MSALDEIIGGLMRRYSRRVPDVGRVIECMVSAGFIDSPDDIENDHVAFRTMGVPHLGISSLEKIFLHHGYERRDHYEFPAKMLDAYWYAPPRGVTPAGKYPRVFISELRVDQLSRGTAATIRKYTDSVIADPVDALDLNNGAEVDEFLHRPLWRTPTVADYESLVEESEYAAWVIYNRYYLNHFTVSVHSLPEVANTVEKFNQFLERNEFRLNDAGGKIKTSRDGLLIQSSTVAEMVNAEFDDGAGGVVSKSISGSYVEFAERRPLAEFAHLTSSDLTRAHRRDGFEVANADKIFESTYSHQTSPGDKFE